MPRPSAVPASTQNPQNPWFQRALAAAAVFSSLAIGACSDSNGPTSPDPNPAYRERLLAANGTTLHVIDYGGSGAPVVFLAGLGNSAHVFDDFAPRFTDRYHAFAFTRRGFGQSGRPADGYDTESLARDVVALLDSLGVDRAVLVGHSIAGDELTEVAARFPSRVAGLVYLEAAYDRSNVEARLAAMAAANALPPTPPAPTSADKASVAAFRDYIARLRGVRWPEREVSAVNQFDNEGHYVGDATDVSITIAILEGVAAPKYRSVTAPALALYAVERGIEQDYPWVPTLEQDREEAEAQAQRAIAFENAWEAGQRAAFRQALPAAHVVEVPQASHYIFLSNVDLVEREIRAFLQPM
jgi:non-heme chloroperoxidase